ncbi:MAG: cytochrome-c oxidase, cbb3-type subunit III [Rhodobacteraceae bacterium]|nr:cytochrome-c oxidase, cbb3-type subunit III [Paracoccaceae bacterium]
MKRSRPARDSAPPEPEYTGHEWDGIREYNNPMPRWWLWTLYASIIWGIAYTIAYPAWPLLTRATQGVLDYSSRAELAKSIKEFEDRNSALDLALLETDLTAVHLDADLLDYALRGGAAVYRAHCSQCHGAGASGTVGYPNLLDDDWLWGGSLDDIYYTVAHGIRSDADEDTRFSQMPAYDGFLEPDQIDSVVHYVLALSGQEHNPELSESGAEIYAENCAVCHGETGLGNRDEGGPRLTDPIWLYGGSEDAIRETIRYSRFSVMPNWRGRLSESHIRQVAIYVHQLGGGE